MEDLKRLLLEGLYDQAIASVEMTGSILTVPARDKLTAACEQIAQEKGFGKAVEVVINLSRKLKFLLADPSVDALEVVEIPLPSGQAVARLEANPKRADRGNVAKLIEHGIIDPKAPEESWMYEAYAPAAMGTQKALDGDQSGWAKKMPGAVKCFLCSGLGEGRTQPVNPNEIFISCPGPVEPIFAGCNFAALGPYHMTAFAKSRTQQRVDGMTVAKTLAILDALQAGSDPKLGAFTVIHNGDLVCNVSPEGKVSQEGAGATLLHDHNQFMRASLPILAASMLASTETNGVKAAVVNWPSSVIRFEAPAAKRVALVEAANALIASWKASNVKNTANFIATTAAGNTVLFVCLRRVGMVDAPGKKCVSSLEQAGIIVLDEQDVFAKYAAADAAERLSYLQTVLAAVDPVLADAGNDAAKKNAFLKNLIKA